MKNTRKIFITRYVTKSVEKNGKITEVKVRETFPCMVNAAVPPSHGMLR